LTIQLISSLPIGSMKLKFQILLPPNLRIGMKMLPD